MSDKVVDTLDDIKRYGKRFEKQRAIDSRSVPPPPAEKMHVLRGKWAERSGQPEIAVRRTLLCVSIGRAPGV